MLIKTLLTFLWSFLWSSRFVAKPTNSSITAEYGTTLSQQASHYESSVLNFLQVMDDTDYCVGMLAGIVGDSCHAYTKVLGYHHPELFELLAWWVPPEFGVGGVLLGTIYGPIFRKLESIFNNNSRANEICATRTSFTNTKAFVGPLLFLGAYLLSSLLNAQGVNDQLISIALALIAFISWAYASSAKLSALLLSIMVAAAGVTWESLLCQHGIFFYYRPDRWYVRHWICWLWFAACAGNAPLFLKLEDEMEAKLEKKRR